MISNGKATLYRDPVNELAAEEESFLLKLARLAIVEPVRAGLRLFSSTPSDEDLHFGTVEETKGPLVIRVLLHECAELFWSHVTRKFPEGYGCLQSVVEFVNAVNSSRRESNLPAITDKEDTKILLDYMTKLGKIAVAIDVDGESYVKYSTAGSKLQITVDEINELKLNRLLEKLEQQLKDLSAQVGSLRSSAADHLRKGDRSFALLELKRSKALECIRQDRMKVVSNLHEIVSQIDSAKQNIQSFNAYKIGNVTLRSIGKESEISSSGVEEILSSLQEEITHQNDISNAIAQGLVSIQFDDQDLEKELEDFAADQSSAFLQNAPQVPTKPVLVDSIDETQSEHSKDIQPAILHAVV